MKTQVPKDKMERIIKAKEEAERAYSTALATAETCMGPCNSVRLGIALNYSVFEYEVIGNVELACSIGDKAIKQGSEKLEECDDETAKDA